MNERLSKAQQAFLQDAREAHLTPVQAALLSKARADAARTELERAKAERSYANIVENQGLHAAALAGRRLREANAAAHASAVALAVTETTCGLRG